MKVVGVILVLLFAICEATNTCKLINSEPTPVQLITTTYANVFAVCVYGGDLRAAQKEHKKVIEKVGVNSKRIQPYFDALRDLIYILKDGNFSLPNDQAELAEVIDRYLITGTDFIKSQPGFATFPDDPVLKAEILKNPENDPIYTQFYQIVGFTQAILSNPIAPEIYFNAFTAASFAQYDVLMAKVSAELTQKKKN